MSGSPLGYALRLLKRRFMSAWEIDQALLRRGVEEDDRKAVLTELFEIGMLNDERFAKAYVHDRDMFSPRSRWLLARELQQKGVAEAIIKPLLENDLREEGGVGDYEQALALAERHERRLAGLERDAYQRRLSGVLARRGFSAGTISKVLKEKGPR